MTPEERAEKRYPCPQDAQSLILVVRGALQEGCATTIREEVEPLEAENAKLRALVQVLLDGCNEAIEMQQAQRGCISDAEVNLPTCMNGFSTAKEAGFTPTTDEVR